MFHVYFFDLWVRWSKWSLWIQQVAMTERLQTIQCTVNLGTQFVHLIFQGLDPIIQSLLKSPALEKIQEPWNNQEAEKSATGSTVWIVQTQAIFLET